MKRNVLLALIPLAALLSCTESVERMESEFRTPPQEARPRVWWHWEDGNVTKDGIRKDLEWMHRIGVAGFHHFDAALAIDPVVEKRLVYMDDGWKDAFKYAIGFADSLGMSVGIASSPGWSSTGGPWVSEDDAMKQLVWSSVDVSCGHFASILPEPVSKLGFYRDIRTVALRLPETDGSMRSIMVKGNDRRPRWAAPDVNYNLVLEASDDGREFREICRIPTTSAERITVNFPATDAEFFRLYDVEGREVPEYVLYTRSRVEHAEEKTGLSSPYDLNDYPTEILGEESFPGRDSVLDLSDMVGEDGSLDWDVPEGEWRIIRFGYTLTGKKNGPAPVEATGLEVDKLDPDAWSRYFHKYLDMYVDASAGMLGQRGISQLLVDSYEAWWQTWTPRMEEEFSGRRGYSLLQWMPALSGEIIESPEATERFLFDWRRTIGELYAENYARIKEYAAEYKLKEIYLEAQENGRVYLVDGMDVKKSATVPMSACWTNGTFHIDRKVNNNYVADMRESSSVAHIYGKQFAATESFTVDGMSECAFSFSPANLKPVADLEFASGINRIYIHESSHQPLDSLRPGLGLLKYGQWFSRHETWAEQAVAWTDYLARTSYMLSRGMNIADILVYYGEDTNITGRYAGKGFSVPSGYAFDYINPSGLFDISVRNGRIVAPSGARYELLCLDIAGLPQSDEVKARIEGLRKAGARICDVSELQDAVSSIPCDVLTESNIRFVHRHAGNAEIYWISKPSDGTETVTLSFRDSDRTPACWNPVDGTVTPVPFIRKDGRTTVTIEMAPDDAKFIVFSGRRIGKCHYGEDESCSRYTRQVIDRWSLEFPGRKLENVVPADYSTFPYEDVKYFSGTACYSTVVKLCGVPEKAVIDLGEVHDLAEVCVNGQKAAILWTRPFRTDISGYLKEGENTISVMVTNTWANRLIGDEQPDCPGRTTYTSSKFYSAQSGTFPAGLAGPVTLLTETQDESRR